MPSCTYRAYRRHEISLWILSFLTEQKQWIWMNDAMPHWITTSSGALQSCDISTLLFILNTDCCFSNNNISWSSFQMFLQLLTVLVLILSMKLKLKTFSAGIHENSLQLDISKTREQVTDQAFCIPAPVAYLKLPNSGKNWHNKVPGYHHWLRGR